jgi:hypothetical protein
MVEAGEDLPLGQEAMAEHGALQPRVEDLHRHLALLRRVLPHGEMDRAHAAVAERAQQPVGAEALPFLHQRRGEDRARRPVQQGGLARVGGEQPLDLLAQRGPPRAGAVEPGRPPVRGEVQGRREDLVDLAPEVGPDHPWLSS